MKRSDFLKKLAGVVPAITMIPAISKLVNQDELYKASEEFKKDIYIDHNKPEAGYNESSGMVYVNCSG